MPQHINRRDFLRLAGIGGGAAIVGGLGPSRSSAAAGKPLAYSSRGTGQTAFADVGSRVLVVLELGGGNDGISMTPPADIEVLAGLRPTALHPEEALFRPGNGVLLHPAFERLQHRPLTIIDGVGTPSPDLSHFEMMRRWWAGDPDGTTGQTTGFLGRLCDMLDDGAPATGLSIGNTSTPAMVSERAGTIGLPPLWWLWWLTGDDGWGGAYRDGLAAMSTPDNGDGETLAVARRSLNDGLGLGNLVSNLPEVTDYPETDLGSNLALASQLIAADLGVRVFHVAVDGDYDTHEGHLDRHSELMGELDEALDVFLADLDGSGDTGRVLVATTSEFGRRPEENGDGGLDHGTASSVMLAGPVTLQRLGEPLSLTDFDDDGNFVATMSMDRYYATLADWFEIPPSDVLPGNPEALDAGW